MVLDTRKGKNMTTEKLSPVKAIKKFFELADDITGGEPGKPVQMAEMKQLSKTDRDELGSLCNAELSSRGII